MNKLVDNLWGLPVSGMKTMYDEVTEIFGRPVLRVENDKMYMLPYGESAAKDKTLGYFETTTSVTSLTRIAISTAVYYRYHEMEKPIFVDIDVPGLTLGEIKDNMQQGIGPNGEDLIHFE